MRLLHYHAHQRAIHSVSERGAPRIEILTDYYLFDSILLGEVVRNGERIVSDGWLGRHGNISVDIRCLGVEKQLVAEKTHSKYNK